MGPKSILATALGMVLTTEIATQGSIDFRTRREVNQQSPRRKNRAKNKAARKARAAQRKRG